MIVRKGTNKVWKDSRKTGKSAQMQTGICCHFRTELISVSSSTRFP
ncbi:hypothetical protein HMPREF0658_1598 [Hoylesella marshii DSM 16973 = JCM 13450]|uniref:Uncharacterized protein n=1 Tax=Hoylesella marshii DSM 16973 = JCM 13450 TaxID=862515 RepID=E0NTU5_9BACT|nr:hypothetical protein HMPREF0658_1598 [Hoylesella marshii DSM 16973 = JCM 13450]